ncbi:MAG TPA: polyprenyl synthetase family protein [Spirochaetales bacterium]|nr:polyprenyl synthetase family protein [Spirochaetales bacterium]
MQWAEYSESQRKSISHGLEARLELAKSWCVPVAQDAVWTVDQIHDFAIGGKMLRGILASLSYEIFAPGLIEELIGSDVSDNIGEQSIAMRLACGIELIQAGLLVHDDIMDKDELRRGKPTLHKVFAAHNASEAAGQGQAICAGDLFYFLSIQDFARVGASIGELVAQELSMVCIAQMEDCKSGEAQDIPALERVLSLYRYKTGRYTIVLPLKAGAAAAGRFDAFPFLEEMGENLGILFQIQDDRLGLFGDEQSLGKPIGSDIREGKKTPYVLFLLEALPAPEKRIFEGILGKGSVSASEIEYVRTLIMQHGIDEKVAALARGYQERATVALERLSSELQGIDYEKLDLLRQFVETSSIRTR